jgi:Kef-type K+ transport system membrane component KefB/nucleotide-binding universal stress UspA family protein
MRLDELIPILLVQIALVLGLSRLLGWLCNRWHQPQVVGEMGAGIMLGPSLLGLISAYAQHHGWLSFDFSHRLFPPESISYLGVLSQVGVIFFLFLVGLELDPKLLRNRGRAAVVISHVSIGTAMLAGSTVALLLYPTLFQDAPAMRFGAVALFMGVAMSIAAFPVMARILTERNLTHTKVGVMAITCAAVDDITGWCLLAFVVAVARASGLQSAMVTAALAAAYVLAMFVVVKPFVARLRLVHERERGGAGHGVFALVVLLTLASAWTTAVIGIHPLFGAFLMGAIMPKGSDFVRTLAERIESFTVVFLLPIFFAYTGLKTQIGLLNRPELWGITALIVCVACAAKLGGSALAARACGLSWRESSAIGILMNTRGLMELVILNVGRDLGVITPVVFAMMVIMALVTTCMTTPLLQLVMPKRLYQAAHAAGARVKTRGFSVLIPVAHPKSGGPLLQLAATLVDPGAERAIFALHLRRPADREAYHPLLADERRPETEEVLRPLLAHAERHRIPVESISFTATDIAAGVAEVATERQASLVLIGFHHSVFSRTMLGGTVHRILESVETDVAVFVDRGYLGARKVLVPYRGGEHDRLALQIAARAARGGAAQVEVLHVTTSGARGATKPTAARTEAERVFASPRSAENALNWAFRSIDDPSPVDAVLRESSGYDLVVIGVSEEWGLESHLFGLRPERIAEQSPTSMLIVRKFGEARELPSESDTTASASPPTEVGGPAITSVS